MTEVLKIFDEYKNEIGKADREEIHRKGLWHETFQCWFVEEVEGVEYIYFQKRSAEKKDFPNLLDITAAGHLMADETVHDGIREVKEELGMDVEFEELTLLGIIEDSITTTGFVDREFAHVFLYRKEASDEFSLQLEEVSGMFKARFNDFEDLCNGKKKGVHVQGFIVDELGKKVAEEMDVSLDHFVPHGAEYWEKVTGGISELLNEKS